MSLDAFEDVSSQCAQGSKGILRLEVSNGGMKVGRIKDPLYKDSVWDSPTYLHPNLKALKLRETSVSLNPSSPICVETPKALMSGP